MKKICLCLLFAALAYCSGLRAETAPELKAYTEALPGTDIKFEMLPIPGGKFMQGSAENEPGRNADEGPRHEVEIKPMWVSKYEVTWDEFDVYAYSIDIKMKKNNNVDMAKQNATEKNADAVTRPTPPYTDMTFKKGHDRFPAICMTHHAAMEYCRWLAAKTGKPYRLLTEAEWEYACRAGSTTAYSFGDDPKDLGDYAWFMGNSNKGPKQVGLKKPNAWGLYDMQGNVSEWVLDFYKKDAYAEFKDKTAVQPVVLPNDKEYPYVSKGGSWDDKPKDLRCATRRASNDDYSIQDPQLPQSIWWHTDALFVGIRVCCPVQEQENLKGIKSPIKSSDDRH